MCLLVADAMLGLARRTDKDLIDGVMADNISEVIPSERASSA